MYLVFSCLSCPENRLLTTETVILNNFRLFICVCLIKIWFEDQTREINSKTAIKVIIFIGLFVNVAQGFDNMQQKVFGKFFGYLNLSWKGGSKQCRIWGPEIIKILEKIYCLTDSNIKVAKNIHNYLQYKVFSSCWFLMRC